MSTTTHNRAALLRGGFAPGIDDQTVRDKTGKGWDEWHAILEARGVTEESFTETVRFLSGEHDLSTWWATTVAAHYRRERGGAG